MCVPLIKKNLGVYSYILTSSNWRINGSGVCPSHTLKVSYFWLLRLTLKCYVWGNWPLLSQEGWLFLTGAYPFFHQKTQKDKGCFLLVETWVLFLMPITWFLTQEVIFLFLQQNSKLTGCFLSESQRLTALPGGSTGCGWLSGEWGWSQSQWRCSVLPGGHLVREESKN